MVERLLRRYDVYVGSPCVESIAALTSPGYVVQKTMRSGAVGSQEIFVFAGRGRRTKLTRKNVTQERRALTDGAIREIGIGGRKGERDSVYLYSSGGKADSNFLGGGPGWAARRGGRFWGGKEVERVRRKRRKEIRGFGDADRCKRGFGGPN